MCNKISTIIVRKYIKKNIINEEDYEVYVYSFERLISKIVSLFFLFIVSLLFNMVFEGILFYIGFSLFRKSSGGFHAKNPLSCNILSIVNEIIVFIILRITITEYRTLACICIVTSSLLCCFILAPIDHPNKRFNKNEYMHYKKVSRIVSLTSSIIVVILNIVIPNNIYIYCYCLGVISANISLIIALKERRKYVKENLRGND